MPILNEDAKRLVSANIPDFLIEEIGGNDYVRSASYIDVLNKIFDYEWSWTIKDYWITNELKKSSNGNEQLVVHVLGTLRVPYYDNNGELRYVEKDGFGGATISGNTAKQHEDSYKKAESDAIKRAARNFGIFLELWRRNNNKEYFNLLQKPTSWTEDDLVNYKTEISYLKEYLKGKTEEEQAAIFREFSNNKIHNVNGINHSNIIQFCDFLKSKKGA